MKRKPIKKLIKSPEIIPGIYNYCDRWCERCSFTKRCVNYAMGQSMEEGTFEKEMDDFFETFEDPFEKFDIEVPDEQDIEETASEERQRKDKINNNECAVLSMAYTDMITRWLKTNEKLLKDNKEYFQNNNQTDNLIKFKNAIEVISWYMFQIHVKIMRALHGTIDDFDEPDEYPKDSDGSAKVALIGIDNSITCWKDLRYYLPGKEDIDDIILLLAELTKMVEKIFPKARSFIRPGFDETQN